MHPEVEDVQTTAYYTQRFDEVYSEEMYGVVDDATGHLIAYCTNPEDAERLKALLVYYGEQFPR